MKRDVKQDGIFGLHTRLSFCKRIRSSRGLGLGLGLSLSGRLGRHLLLRDPVLVRQIDPQQQHQPEDEEADHSDAQAEVEVGHPPGPKHPRPHDVVAGRVRVVALAAAAAVVRVPQVGDGLGVGRVGVGARGRGGIDLPTPLVACQGGDSYINLSKETKGELAIPESSSPAAGVRSTTAESPSSFLSWRWWWRPPCCRCG